MKSLTGYLTQYAAYHRDRRNIATHFVGIPMIVLALVILLSRPGFELLSITVSPAAIAAVAALVFYVVLDVRYALTLALLFIPSLFAGRWFAEQSTAVFLLGGIGFFVVGWIFQLVGHVFEGRKPAFVDDLIGLLIGPLFVLAEVGFALRMREEVRAAIEREVGPTVDRRTAGSAAGANPR